MYILYESLQLIIQVSVRRPFTVSTRGFYVRLGYRQFVLKVNIVDNPLFVEISVLLVVLGCPLIQKDWDIRCSEDVAMECVPSTKVRNPESGTTKEPTF